MYSITVFKMKVLVLSIKVLSPYSNKCFNATSFVDMRFGLTILIFFRKDALSFLKLEQWTS